jgi:hypothetical protein
MPKSIITRLTEEQEALISIYRDKWRSIQLLTEPFEFADISYLANSITLPPEWAILGCMFDFCISVLNVRHDKKKWKVLQDLMQYCSFLFLFEKVCILCDRPVKLSFNRENMLQAEREPALQFTDGYSVYADREIHHFQKEQYDEK